MSWLHVIIHWFAAALIAEYSAKVGNVELINVFQAFSVALET